MTWPYDDGQVISTISGMPIGTNFILPRSEKRDDDIWIGRHKKGWDVMREDSLLNMSTTKADRAFKYARQAYQNTGPWRKT